MRQRRTSEPAAYAQRKAAIEKAQQLRTQGPPLSELGPPRRIRQVRRGFVAGDVDVASEIIQH